MFLLCRYDMLFTLETKNIKTRHFFRLRDLPVMSLCRKCEPGLTVGKKSVRNLIYLVSSWIFSHVSFDFEVNVVVSFGLKKEMYLLAAKIPPRCPPCCLL